MDIGENEAGENEEEADRLGVCQLLGHIVEEGEMPFAVIGNHHRCGNEAQAGQRIKFRDRAGRLGQLLTPGGMQAARTVNYWGKAAAIELVCFYLGGIRTEPALLKPPGAKLAGTIKCLLSS